MANENLKELAMLDVAEQVLRDNKEPLSITEIFAKVAEIKDIKKDNFEMLNQFYTDMIGSGKFVYCDNDLWDLKENNLELWDKESYSFTDIDYEGEDDLEDIDFTEFTLPDDFDEIEVTGREEIEEDDDDEEYDMGDISEDAEEGEYIDVELPMVSTDDDDIDETEIEIDDEDFNEDDYDDIMDDYEDMYDE